jgi:hypothetical protein
VAIPPSELSLIAQINAYKSWGNTTDRTARTANGRAANDQKYYEGIDPELPADVREQMAASRRTARMKELALKSARARRKGREAAVEEAEAEAELRDFGAA